MARKSKYPYQVHITKRAPEQEPERLAFQLDGVLFIGTREEEHSNVTIYEGKHWPYMTTKLAMERICLGRDKDFIRTLKGLMGDLFDTLLAEEGAQA